MNTELQKGDDAPDVYRAGRCDRRCVGHEPIDGHGRSPEHPRICLIDADASWLAGWG